MRIGINALFNATGGSLTNLRILLTEWSAKQQVDQQADVFLYVTKQTWEKLNDISLNKIQIRLAPSNWSCFGNRYFFEQFWLPIIGKRDELDVLFCPANTTPLFFHAPIIVTFQNIAPFESGVSWQEMGFQRAIRFRILKYFMLLSARRAKKILFGSQYFRDLFCRSTGLSQYKTAVIPRSTPPQSGSHNLTLDSLSRMTGCQLHQPYLLCVSHLHPYKKLVELIEAFGEAKNSPCLDKVQLVIVGKSYLSSHYGICVSQSIKEFSLTDEVVMPGELEHDQISLLLENADGFIFTSVCENCPTSLVEAIQHGLPILCSNKSSMPEVAGDAALYFDPTDPAEVSKVIRSVYEKNQFAELSDRSKKRAQEWPGIEEMSSLTWEFIVSQVEVKNEFHCHK